MDPITTANQVHQRLTDLQKTTDHIHQERALRSNGSVSADTAASVAITPAGAAEPQTAAANGGCRSAAEPAA